MFVYCANNPMNYFDPTGSIPKNTIMLLDESRNQTVSKRELAKDYADNRTSLTTHTIMMCGQSYTTYYAHFETDLFAIWKDDKNSLYEVVGYYAEYLYERIEKQKIADRRWPYCTMSISHINSEVKSHLCGWFMLSLESTKITDLNVDERRVLVLPLMYWYGYQGDTNIDWGKETDWRIRYD